MLIDKRFLTKTLRRLVKAAMLITFGLQTIKPLNSCMGSSCQMHCHHPRYTHHNTRSRAHIPKPMLRWCKFLRHLEALTHIAQLILLGHCSQSTQATATDPTQRNRTSSRREIPLKRLVAMRSHNWQEHSRHKERTSTAHCTLKSHNLPLGHGCHMGHKGWRARS